MHLVTEEMFSFFFLRSYRNSVSAVQPLTVLCDLFVILRSWRSDVLYMAKRRGVYIPLTNVTHEKFVLKID